MSVKYCLPVIRHQKHEVQERIASHEADYDFFEVWLDYIEGVDEQFVRGLADQYGEKLILLFRREQLDPMRLPPSARQQLLRVLHDSVAFVDLDISQDKEFDFVMANRLRLKLIGSYHNYQTTPDLVELQKIASDIQTHQPEIIKVSACCRHESDALNLLQLQMQLKQAGQRHIVLGMGSHGDVTRIFGTLWGNEFVFAPEDFRDQSAPGQLTRQQLESIFQTLSGNS